MLTGRLGIVGGVGPLAAAHFYQRLIELSSAPRDEDHLAVVLVAERIPSRIDHLMGMGPSPVPALENAVHMLARAGVDSIAVPSATTHAYWLDLVRATTLPLFDLLAAAAAELAERSLSCPLILGTRATAKLRLFNRHLPETITPLYPDPPLQREIDAVIEGVKRGLPLQPLRFRLAELGAHRAGQIPDCLVLGCSELSVLGLPMDDRYVIDAADALARGILRRYGRADPTTAAGQQSPC